MPGHRELWLGDPDGYLVVIAETAESLSAVEVIDVIEVGDEDPVAPGDRASR